MGNEGFKVVKEDMRHDRAQWETASAALGRAAKKAEGADAVAFGAFSSVLQSPFSSGATAVRDFIVSGQKALSGVATNLANNGGQYATDDKKSEQDVRNAGRGGSTGNGSEGGAEERGGKDASHCAELLNGKGVDPKDPHVTFDRRVDPATGEVTWTPRDMRPGEAAAIDGRDVEKIPGTADRIVVTMVNGEPQITYIDKDANSSGTQAGKSEEHQRPHEFGRVMAGSGAVEPGMTTPRTEWSRALPEGADYAVVEVRNGQAHLVFLDVAGGSVTEVADHKLATEPVRLDAQTQPDLSVKKGA